MHSWNKITHTGWKRTRVKREKKVYLSFRLAFSSVCLSRLLRTERAESIILLLLFFSVHHQIKRSSDFKKDWVLKAYIKQFCSSSSFLRLIFFRVNILQWSGDIRLQTVRILTCYTVAFHMEKNPLILYWGK